MVTSEIDRISDLPDGVLEKILSFLRTKEAVQTSAISKRWKNLWAYSPRIDLDHEDFNCYEKFKEFGDMVLSCHATSYLHMFSVTSRHKFDSFNYSDLRKWISLAIKFHPRVFSLKVRIPDFDFVACTFTCASIEELNLEVYLSNYDFSIYSNIVPSTINLPHLKRLRLKHAHLSEEDVSRLLRGCPVVEDLMLNDCTGEFGPIFRQKLIALSLENWDVRPVFSDTQPEIINLPCIRRLHISNAYIYKEGVARLLTGCPLLEDLSLETCSGDFSALFIHKLRHLSIQDCKLHGDNVFWEIHNVILTMNLSRDTVDLLEGLFVCTLHPIRLKFIWNLPMGTAQDFGNNISPSNIFSGAECLKLYFPDAKGISLKKGLRSIKAFNNLKRLSVALVDWCMDPYEIDPVAWFLHNSPIIEELTLYNPKRKPEVRREGKPNRIALCNESAYYNSLSIELSKFKNLKRVEIKFCSNLFRAHSFKEALLKKMVALVNAKVVITDYDDVTKQF